ncbi:hypothetical protein BDR03DRAFT_985181 [Suillus americanus]|nr:hypothetical protein BDR03DRAFT_985181 [Suillus americanus]
MRFSSTIVITLVAALASSSISAMPVEAPETAVADQCPWFCKEDADCGGCAIPSCYVIVCMENIGGIGVTLIPILYYDRTISYPEEWNGPHGTLHPTRTDESAGWLMRVPLYLLRLRSRGRTIEVPIARNVSGIKKYELDNAIGYSNGGAIRSSCSNKQSYVSQGCISAKQNAANAGLAYGSNNY